MEHNPSEPCLSVSIANSHRFQPLRRCCREHRVRAGVSQAPLAKKRRIASNTSLDGLCTALETAQASPLDLCGLEVKADASAGPQRSTGHLVWPEKGTCFTDDTWVTTCGWKEGGPSVVLWTLWRGMRERVQWAHPDLSWRAALACWQNLILDTVKFSGVKPSPSRWSQCCIQQGINLKEGK